MGYEADKLNLNAVKVGRNFTKVRYLLDNKFSRDLSKGEHIFKSPFLSFWVAAWSDTGIEVSILVPKDDLGNALTLKPNMSLSFDSLQAGAIIINETVQAGKWVDIVYAHSSKINSGSVEVNASGNTSLSDGDNFGMTLETVTVAVASLIAASSSRVVTTIENKGSVSIWVGTQANLGQNNYQDLCKEISAGSEIEWRNSAGLYSRTASATNSLIHLTNETT